MIAVLIAAGIIAVLYQVVALLACLNRITAPERRPTILPPVSILKPIFGADSHLPDALRSHATLDYPEFEILLGVRNPRDPALAMIDHIRREHPHIPMRVIVAKTPSANDKVGILADLAREARHGILVVNDADIRVPPDYLRRIVGPLEDPGNGLVTCLYRAESNRLPGIWESLGIAVDFAPSVLVAPLVGVREFGLGSTLAFRSVDLERAGGFEAIADYLADDYQLSKRITGLGLRAVLAKVVVTTRVDHQGWRDMWAHQVRWARTIRVSRGDGYLGLPITHAAIWAMACAFAGLAPLGWLIVACRWAVAIVAGVAVLRSSVAAQWFILAPVWDVWAFIVWLAGLSGRVVYWGGRKLRLDGSGRIIGE